MNVNVGSEPDFTMRHGRQILSHHCRVKITDHNSKLLLNRIATERSLAMVCNQVRAMADPWDNSSAPYFSEENDQNASVYVVKSSSTAISAIFALRIPRKISSGDQIKITEFFLNSLKKTQV